VVTALVGLGFVAGTIALAWAVYFGARHLAARHIADDTREFASSVLFRVSALHGLILALVFAQELLIYQELRSALVQEATAIADIYNDIGRYGGPQVAPVQEALTRYARTVVDEEWSLLAAEGRLLPEAWAHREAIYLGLLDLVPQTPREDALRDHMVEDAQSIATIRQLRENMALRPIDPLFWFAAVTGVALVSLPYFVFRPSLVNVALLSVYGAFTGIVMFVIFAMSDPFSPPALLEPAAMQRLLETEIGAGPDPSRNVSQ
jgi:hypothetical protein